MQAHPEIPLNPDSETLRVSVRGEVNRILHALKGGYGDEVLRLEDQFFPEAEIRNPGESFYTYALDTLTDELFHSIQRGTWIDLFSESQKTDFDLVVDGYQAYLSLKSSTMGDRMQISTQLRQADYLSAIDGIGKVELLCHPDWKVGRGVESYGDVAGVDMMRLLEAQRRFRSETCEETGFLTFNDFGAGNGTFLSEMRDMFERDKSAFFYGVGDRIYFDLYQGLFNRYQDIPEHVRMAFVQEVIRRYQNVSHMVEPTLKAKLGSVLADFRIDSDAPIDFSSMFTSGTVMFAGENEIFLSQEDRDFVRNDPGGRIASMLAELIEHPYLFINGSFDRITLVDFRDYSPDGMVPKEDIRVSIRGTSHLDAGDLMKILDRFVYRLAAD
ncbi:MAG: hypothetical protein QG650_346 [Patescibacteria group bacterium]|nr:hypothetical protein [Patescibacteria group bacterium]